MRLTIVDDDGHPLGELYTDAAHQWRDLLLFASERWEAQARATSGDALNTVLDQRKDRARGFPAMALVLALLVISAFTGAHWRHASAAFIQAADETAETVFHMDLIADDTP